MGLKTRGSLYPGWGGGGQAYTWNNISFRQVGGLILGVGDFNVGFYGIGETYPVGRLSSSRVTEA